MSKKPNPVTKDNLITMQVCRYTRDGKEILNPKPKLALVGAAKPLSDIEKMAKMTQANQMIEEMEKYTETWEEHNDFNISDDMDEEFFNTNFTLGENEIPINVPEVSKEAMEVAEKISDIAEKIESGELNPQQLHFDFVKEPESSQVEETVKTEEKPPE